MKKNEQLEDRIAFDIGHKFLKQNEHWDIVSEIVGFNGAGGAWITEKWNWKNGDTCRTETLTLDYWKTQEYLKGRNKL